MKKRSALGLLLLFIAGFAVAKSQFNTQIYEKQEDSGSFEAVVKVIREVREEIEVAFEGQKGFFTVAPGSLQERLVKSQKNRQPVSVQFNPTSRQILNVEPSTPREIKN